MKELEKDGKLWGLPRDISTMVMYYNKDLFKAAGLPTRRSRRPRASGPGTTS